MEIKIEEIKKLCLRVLENLGLNAKDAEVVFKEYLYGELIGRKSHGFLSFPEITEKSKNLKKDWKIIKEDETYALIDARENIGQLVGKFAMDLAIKKAKDKGIALVGMNNMWSYLMPGYYAKMAVDKDMIGIVMDNAKSRVAPYGEIEPKIGTNPIGWAIPTKDAPFILDMATATRAMGEVRLAERLGTLMPEGMAIDREGKPTREPKEFGALLPFGSYKGYGLGLAIEILAGSFVRAKMGSKIQSGLDRGFLFLVINPEIFVDIKTFKEETSEFIKEVKASKKAEGAEEILVPGEKEQMLLEEKMGKNYLELDDKIVDEIKKLL